MFEVKIILLVSHGKNNSSKLNKAVRIGHVYIHCIVWKFTLQCKYASEFVLNSCYKTVQNLNSKPQSNHRPFLTLEGCSAAFYCYPQSLHLDLNTVKTNPSFTQFGVQ